MDGTLPKKAEKFFKNASHASAVKVLPFYVIDVLMMADRPLTVAEIQKNILTIIGRYYYAEDIRLTLNNMHLYCESIKIQLTRPRIPGMRAHPTAVIIHTHPYIHKQQ